MDDKHGRMTPLEMWRAGNGNRAYISASAFLVLSIIVFAASFVIPHSEPWAPLYGFDRQHVLTAMPTLHDGYVDVSAQKCFREPVRTIGDYSWKLISPRQQTVATVRTESPGVRPAGCITPTYRNQFPLEVISISLDVLAHGDIPTWVIAGEERATDGKRISQLTTWVTDPFQIRAR